jgi:hypothetical protein
MMTNLIEAAEISAKLKETQNSMHALFGARWAAKKAEAERVIHAVMERDQCQILAAAQKAARWALNEDSALFAAIILAAAVDLIEEREGVAA